MRIHSLYFWVVLGMVAGVALGYFAPETGQAMKPLADGFIKLIKMLIGPVVFCTVVTGIAGMRSLKNAGRVGLKAFIYFEVLTILALVLGLLVINISKPGVGMHIDPASLDTQSIKSYAPAAQEMEHPVDFILHIIPTTLTDAFVKGDMLQILFVAILFAIGLLTMGNRGYALYQWIQQLSDLLFRIIGLIVRIAPIGAFGAMAFTVGKYGIVTLAPLAKLMLDFYLTCFLFIAIGLGLVMRMAGLRLWPLLKYLREELLIVLGTSSSEAALPRLMEKLEKMGCSRPVVGMVVPTGYSFNLDGTCIYLTMAAIFIAQATDTTMGLGDQLVILSVLLLTSKGAAGVTGSGFVVLAATLASVGSIPVAGLALLLGIDRFMSEARAITNFIGNAVATVFISRWERALDQETAREQLQLSS